MILIVISQYYSINFKLKPSPSFRFPTHICSLDLMKTLATKKIKPTKSKQSADCNSVALVVVITTSSPLKVLESETQPTLQYWLTVSLVLIFLFCVSCLENTFKIETNIWSVFVVEMCTNWIIGQMPFLIPGLTKRKIRYLQYFHCFNNGLETFPNVDLWHITLLKNTFFPSIATSQQSGRKKRWHTFQIALLSGHLRPPQRTTRSANDRRPPRNRNRGPQFFNDS